MDHLSATFAACGLEAKVRVVRVGSSVSDGTSFAVVGTNDHKSALLISPSSFPTVVADDQARAAAMRAHLAQDLGSVILTPLAEGQMLGRSYVLLPFRRSPSENSLVWRIQRPQIKRQAIEWVQSVNARHSVVAKSSDEFVCSLDRLQKLQGIDHELRSAASIALNRILTGKLQPRIVPAHNDLWKGNILRQAKHDRTASGSDIVIIDWRGSRTDGFPIYDLTRILLSMVASPSELRAEMERATKALNCDLSDCRSYLMVALGSLAVDLDQFPRESFLRLARSCSAGLARAGL